MELSILILRLFYYKALKNKQSTLSDTRNGLAIRVFKITNSNRQKNHLFLYQNEFYFAK
jgi:hypothetical protein